VLFLKLRRITSQPAADHTQLARILLSAWQGQQNSGKSPPCPCRPLQDLQQRICDLPVHHGLHHLGWV